MSLCVIIDGGLGNQLFMIFTCISKAIDEKRDFSIFPIYNNSIRSYYFTSMLKYLLFKVSPNIPSNEIYKEPYFSYQEIPDNLKVIRGYFQSPKYFHHNRNQIMEMLGFNDFKNRFKFETKTVAIHLRFGDMSFNQGNHAILKPDYFINSLNILLNMINKNEYRFVIFGEKNDDELIDDYIKLFKNFNIKFEKMYEIHKDLNDWKELFYMSSCDHFIIANSTYSWFGAYLSNNPQKIVFYPNEWFGVNNRDNSLRDLFMDNWIKVK
jgi:hypothetical protein